MLAVLNGSCMFQACSEELDIQSGLFLNFLSGVLLNIFVIAGLLQIQIIQNDTIAYVRISPRSLEGVYIFSSSSYEASFICASICIFFLTAYLHTPTNQNKEYIMLLNKYDKLREN